MPVMLRKRAQRRASAMTATRQYGRFRFLEGVSPAEVRGLRVQRVQKRSAAKRDLVSHCASRRSGLRQRLRKARSDCT